MDESSNTKGVAVRGWLHSLSFSVFDKIGKGLSSLGFDFTHTIDRDSGIVTYRIAGELGLEVSLIPAIKMSSFDMQYFSVNIKLVSSRIQQIYNNVKPWQCEEQCKNIALVDDSIFYVVALCNFYAIQKKLGVKEPRHTYSFDSENATHEVDLLIGHFERVYTEKLESLLIVENLYSEMIDLANSGQMTTDFGLQTDEPYVMASLLNLLVNPESTEESIRILDVGIKAEMRRNFSYFGRECEDLKRLNDSVQCIYLKYIEFIRNEKDRTAKPF